MAKPKQVVVWEPQPRQALLLQCPVFEVLFGGARGGGKTDAMLGDFCNFAAQYGKDAIALTVRRERTQLMEMIERSKQIYGPIGAKFTEQNKTWRFPNGARMNFAYLESDADAESYQGHNYCVGVGTRVLMADGSLKAVEQISAGERVATLEGPRRVLAAVPPFLANCVSVQVQASGGEVLGEQIHPVSHPVLSSAGLISSRTHSKLQTSCQSLHGTLPADRQAGGFPLDDNQGLQAWYAWSTDDRNGRRVFEDGNQESAPLPRPSVPVVLHEPSVHSILCGRPHCGRLESKEYPISGELRQSSLCRFRDRIFSLQDRQPQLEQVQLGEGRSFPCQSSVLSYGRTDWRTRLSYLQHYLRDFYPRDLFFPALLKSGLTCTLPQDDAATSSRAGRADESGTTPIRNRHPQPSWVHPYTGEAHDLAEQVQIGRMESRYYGMAWVADLEVEDANHYITETGLINRNSAIYIEELGNFPNPIPVMKLMATLRSPNQNVKVRFRATANPGGPGALWIRQRYIDPAPKGMKIIRDEYTNPFTGSKMPIERVYIPSKVTDNKYCNTDQYIAQLQLSAGKRLLHAWLHGDWSIIEGAFFEEWDAEKHVIQPFVIPPHWTRFCSADWGSASPFAIHWWAVVPGDANDDGIFTSSGGGSYDGVQEKLRYRGDLPAGAMVCYREWYGSPNHSNTGLKLHAEEVARGIVERERYEPRNDMGRARISYRVMDPDACKDKGGPSIAERMGYAPNYVFWQPADNMRVGRRGFLGGWDALRARLKGDAHGRPMIYFFTNCEDAIRTLPVMQHDPDNVEDMMKQGEDHCFAAGTRVQTAAGSCPIEKLPEEGMIVTRGGRLAPYRSARRTKRMALMVEVTFSDGVMVKCTPDHKFLLPSGKWRKAQYLLDCALEKLSGSCVACVKIEAAPREDAYCITVPDTECFAIESGIIVSNCVDSIRYAAMSRPYVTNLERKQPDRMFAVGPGNQLTIDDVMDGHSHKPKVHFERIR